jgi:pre-60S factor REI1
LEQHKKSKNHKRAEKVYLEANPDVTHSSMFQNITTDKPLFGSIQALSAAHSSQTHSERDEHEDNPIHDHDIHVDLDEKGLPERTSLDSLRICLFCNKELSGVKKCLDHMRMKHSFYLLDIDCVTSLKGLLTYIAERIQLGYLCLFCNKMFRNARRCQQHMMDKSHCFMNVEDEHEYEQYYDFSKTYEGHPNAAAAASEEGKEKRKTPLLTKKTNKDDLVEEDGGDGWEDVDVEDAGSGEEVESSSDEEEGSRSDEKKKG